MENAEIKFSLDIIKRIARNEYGNVPYAWIREVLQNSLDAKSKNIYITNDDSGHISVLDDGCGMDYDVLVNAFLTLGGTKKHEGDVGGFGKAKEIELFAWDFWEIRTSTGNEAWHVSSEHINKKPIDSIEPDFTGTYISIKTDNEYDWYTWDRKIKQYIRTCTTKCNIYYNGEKIKTMDMRGKKINTDWCDVTYNKSRDTGDVYIRNGGITMFETYAGITGTVIIDLTRPSTEILTSSRESFRGDYSYKFDRLLNKITVDTKTTFKYIPPMILEDYHGKDIMNEIMETVNEMRSLSEEEKHAIRQIVIETEEEEIPVEEKIAILEKKAENVANYNVASGIEHALRVTNRNMEQESVMGFNFVVYRQEDKVPKLDPNSRKCQTILNMTKNILVRLAPELGITKTLGVGLTYPTDDDNDNVAKLYSEGGKDYVLINPSNVQQTRDYMSLGVDMFNSIAHELAHITYNMHNEEFCSLWTTYMRYYTKDIREWNKIFKDSKAEVKTKFIEMKKDVVEDEENDY